MGFLDFLKKNERKAKRNVERNVSRQANQALTFDNKSSSNIPPPPQGSQETKTEANTSDPFAQTNDTTADPFAPTNDTSNDPFATTQQNQDLFAQTNNAQENSSNQEREEFVQDPFAQTTNSNEEFTDFDPEEPDSFMQRKPEDFGPTQDYDWSHAEVLEEPTAQAPITQEQPIQEETQQEAEQDEEDFSLPDLPELPEDAWEESKGVNLNEQETKDLTLPDNLKAKLADASNKEVTNTQEKENDLEEENVESNDPSLKSKPPYEKEDEKEIKPHIFYVETHEFYDTLQEIKATKKTVKECDVNTHGWEDLDSKTNKKIDSLIEDVDHIQESLMNIDAALFER